MKVILKEVVKETDPSLTTIHINRVIENTREELQVVTLISPCLYALMLKCVYGNDLIGR